MGLESWDKFLFSFFFFFFFENNLQRVEWQHFRTDDSC